MGRDFGRTHVFSEKTLRDIDCEVKRIVDEQLQRAHVILDAHRPSVETVKDALLERETVDAEDFQLLMKGQPLPPRKLTIDHSLDAAGDPMAEPAAADSMEDSESNDSEHSTQNDPH